MKATHIKKDLLHQWVLFLPKTTYYVKHFSCKLPIINKVNAPSESIMNQKKSIFLSKTSSLTQYRHCLYTNIGICMYVCIYIYIGIAVYPIIFTSNFFSVLNIELHWRSLFRIVLSGGKNKEVSVLLLYKCLSFQSLLSNEFKFLSQEIIILFRHQPWFLCYF